MAEAYDVALAPHCPLGPVALAACLQLDFVAWNAMLQEQSMGIHYNRGAELLDYVINKDDFRIDNGYIHALPKPGLGVEVDAVVPGLGVLIRLLAVSLRLEGVAADHAPEAPARLRRIRDCLRRSRAHARAAARAHPLPGAADVEGGCAAAVIDWNERQPCS